jgi:HAE1 family hydrophobic/amphiphilic exporter-1
MDCWPGHIVCSTSTSAGPRISFVHTSNVLIHKSAFAMVGLAIVGVLAVFLGSSLPGGFLPTEDQGYMFLALQLPDSASAQRTDEAQQKITAALLKTPGVEGVIAVTNFSLLTQVQAPTPASSSLPLNPGRRARPRSSSFRISRPTCRNSFSQIQMELLLRFHRPPFQASELLAA